MDTSTKSLLSNRYFFTRGRKASDDYDQFWIRYKPERVVRKRLKRWGKFDRALLLISVVALLALGAVFGLNVLYVAIATLLGLYLVYKLHFMMYPTHIALSEAGIQLHWLHSFCNFSSGMISWERLTHVSISKRKFLGETESMVEFNVLASRMRQKDRLGYQLIAPELSSGWFKGERCMIKLRLNGIASSDDRKRLQLALKKFLPSYRIEPSVSDELNLGLRVETYTDLWLDALNSNSSRIREDALIAGIHILEGAYEVVDQIGAGGQAIVYEAIDRRGVQTQVPTKKVVLKEFVLPAHAGANVRKRVLENIQKEADLLKGLKHPNVVKLLDFFVEDQRAYLVLERIDGDTLSSLIANKGPLTEQQAVAFGLQMCEILSYLHSQKVVHRDFTPDNLILAHGDILKLIDFNVAQQLEADSIKNVVGKHAYIPPEQFRGKASSQSDIYAVGGTLFFLLTGKEPEPISVSHPHAERSSLSPDIDAIVARATDLDLTARYADCSRLRKDLQKLKDLYG